MEEFWDRLDSEDLRVVFTPGPSIREGYDKALSMVDDFLTTLPNSRLDAFTYLSSTSVYGDADGQWVNETTPMDPYSQSGELRRAVEQKLTANLSDSRLVRCRIGGIYGPGRNAAERYLSDDYELVGDENWTNRIRVEDLARLIVALTAGPFEGIYNLVDERPSQLEDLVEFLYRETGKDPGDITRVSWAEAEERYSDMRLGLLKPQKKVSSRKVQEELGFRYRYPTPYVGLKDLVA